MATEADIFQAWTEGVFARWAERSFKGNPHDPGSAKWRAWGRGFRAWERDAKHRKPPKEAV